MAAKHYMFAAFFMTLNIKFLILNLTINYEIMFVVQKIKNIVTTL